MQKNYPSEKTKREILAASGNQCAYPECSELIFDLDHKVILGEIAHIKGRKPKSARYDSNQSDAERNSFSNLIALCKNHHTLIDKAPNMYKPEHLHKWKDEHESKIAKILDKNWVAFSAPCISRMTNKGTITFHYWIDKKNKPRAYTKEQLVKIDAIRKLYFLFNDLNDLLKCIKMSSSCSQEIKFLKEKLSRLEFNEYGLFGTLHENFQIMHDLTFLDYTSTNTNDSSGKRVSRDTLIEEALEMICKKVEDTPNNPHIEK